MDDASTERMHHNDLRKYRRELALAPAGLKKAKLVTLIARAQIDAEYYGWGRTVD
jgi:hypothetical protein